MRSRRVVLGVLMSLSLAAGVGAAALPATPASAACSIGVTANSPYKSGSNVRSKILFSASCKGHFRIDHWVNRNGSQVKAWQTFYTAPYNGSVDRSVGTCRSGKYRAFVGIYFVGSSGSVAEGRNSSKEVSISC